MEAIWLTCLHLKPQNSPSWLLLKRQRERVQTIRAALNYLPPEDNNRTRVQTFLELIPERVMLQKNRRLLAEEIRIATQLPSLGLSRKLALISHMWSSKEVVPPLHLPPPRKLVSQGRRLRR